MPEATNMEILETNEMLHFVQGLRNPAPMPEVGAQACGGGVPQCAGLRSAFDELLTAAKEFLTACDNGFTSYKAIVSACHAEYLENDRIEAERVAAVKFRTDSETVGALQDILPTRETEHTGESTDDAGSGRDDDVRFGGKLGPR